MAAIRTSVFTLASTAAPVPLRLQDPFSRTTGRRVYRYLAIASLFDPRTVRLYLRTRVVTLLIQLNIAMPLSPTVLKSAPSWAVHLMLPLGKKIKRTLLKSCRKGRAWLTLV